MHALLPYLGTEEEREKIKKLAQKLADLADPARVAKIAPGDRLNNVRDVLRDIERALHDTIPGYTYGMVMLSVEEFTSELRSCNVRSLTILTFVKPSEWDKEFHERRYERKYVLNGAGEFSCDAPNHENSYLVFHTLADVLEDLSAHLKDGCALAALRFMQVGRLFRR